MIASQTYVLQHILLPVLNFPGQMEPIFGFSSTHCQDPPFLGSTKRKCPSVHSIRHPSTSSPRVLSQKKPYININSLFFCYYSITQFSYLMAVIVNPKLVLISTLTISQRILSLVAEVHRWRRGHGGVVRVRVAAHLESSRTPSIINTTHPVMGDSVDVDNLSFCTSLLYMGSIFKTHPEKGENKK